jgi:hypothetical protein
LEYVAGYGRDVCLRKIGARDDRVDLASRKFPTLETIKVALPEVDPDSRVELLRPDQPGRPSPLDFGFIDPQRRGVTLANGLTRGIYRITVAPATAVDQVNKVDAGERPETMGKASGAEPRTDAADVAFATNEAARQFPLALNGPARESDLVPLPNARQESLEANPALRWLSSGEAISLEGAQLRGQGSWWWLALFVLAALVFELVILGRLAAGRAVQTT